VSQFIGQNQSAGDQSEDERKLNYNADFDSIGRDDLTEEDFKGLADEGGYRSHSGIIKPPSRYYNLSQRPPNQDYI